jgi:hypothetical protein
VSTVRSRDTPSAALQKSAYQAVGVLNTKQSMSESFTPAAAHAASLHFFRNGSAVSYRTLPVSGVPALRMRAPRTGSGTTS